MAGNSTVPKFDYPLIFNITQPAPIDSRGTISSINNLATEIPLAVRHTGLLSWVEDIKSFYYFKDGVDDSHFIPFSISNNIVYKFLWISTETITNGYLFNHGLNTEHFTIQFYLDNRPVFVEYELLPYDAANPSDHQNNIKLIPPIGYTIPAGLRIVMMH